MNRVALEQRLIEAFADARETVEEAPDLFARVTRSLEEAQARRRFRWRLASWTLVFVLANTALALALSDYDNRRITMAWWVIELLTNIVLVTLAVCLGPFIKRFGRSYAADVFRNNPRTGKSYLVLTDVAYYLIFASFVLFTVTFVEPNDWVDSTGAQLKHQVARIGGILLIMGVLHAANVVALPIIGQLLTGPKPDGGGGGATGTGQRGAVPPLGPGTWVLRIEAAPTAETTSDPPAEPSVDDR